MSRLIAFLWRSSRGAFLVAVVAGMLGGLGGVGLLALIPRALEASGSTAWLGWTFAALCVTTIAARVAAQIAMIRLAQGSVASLVRNLCERILALSLPRFERHDPAHLTAVLTEDVMVLTNALSAIPGLGINLTIVIGCFAYLGTLSPPLLLGTLAFLIPAVASYELLVQRGQARLMAARRDQDVLVEHFRALVEGFKELKLHRARRESFLTESIADSAARVRTGNTSGLALFAVVGGWGQFLYLSYLGILVFVMPAFITISRDRLAAAVLTIVYAFSPLDALLAALPFLARAGASMSRIDALGLAIAADSESPRTVATFGPFRESLTLDDVTYAYPSEQGGEGFTLGPIRLTIARGEILFLVGGNGSGKTSLVKLVAGLYEPRSGSIQLDGQTISEPDREAYRQLFTVVFADGFLFPSLQGLDPSDLDSRAGRLLAELKLDAVVTVRDGVFSTTRLSQGQRRRLALAAACLEDRPILVFDEWAAYQDPAFKRAFYREILPALKAQGRTLIVITHDDEYFSLADRLIHIVCGSLQADAPALAGLAASIEDAPLS